MACINSFMKYSVTYLGIFAFFLSTCIMAADEAVAEESCEKQDTMPGEQIEKTSATLHTGQEMPLVGLGTWQAPKGEVGNAVEIALKQGYRHIDCAACYGNEDEIGGIFAKHFKGDSPTIKREDVFITSKLWNSEHQPVNVVPACKKTLEDLQLDYLDLYLMHWPQAFQKVEGTTRGFPRREDNSIIYDDNVTIVDTWKAMEELVDLGLVKAIGLSNFNSKQIEEIMANSRIKPACNQVESHVFFQQEKLIGFCKQHNIVATAYSPLGTGAQVDGHVIAKLPQLEEIGKKYGKSAAQVAIAFHANRGVPTFPKSVTESRVKLNLETTFKLSDEDMAAIKALDKNMRMGWAGPKVERNGVMEPRDYHHKDYPFKREIEF
eukprot:m.46876 g.46876  ORF g.46876 m.46876 type:complete len:378 (-) comp10424_c0_seq1:1082-2215(-)